MSQDEIGDPVTRILRRDPRYEREAYDFVQDALRRKISAIGEVRHLSARELLESIREFAIESFGPLARTVFTHWGVRTTDDFGQVVFNLIDEEDMGKTDDDHIEDFAAVYDFADVFPDDAGPVRIERASDEDGDDDEAD